MKLNVKAFALAGALIWGFGLFFTAWWIMLFEGATGELTLLGHIYHGFNISPVGSLMGLLWGLADGFVCGFLFAWLYNRLAKPESAVVV